MRLNRWNSGHIIIRSLAPIPTAGLGQQDIPALMEQCRAQMQQCIQNMERELQHA
ncbi:hypothetical protein D3C78_1914680 [compost metagenome]